RTTRIPPRRRLPVRSRGPPQRCPPENSVADQARHLQIGKHRSMMNLRLQGLILTLCLTLPAALHAGPRLDQIQVIGTHNSYHIAPHPTLRALIQEGIPAAAESVEYTH